MCSFKNAEPSRNKQISFSNFQHQRRGCTEYTCTAPGKCTVYTHKRGRETDIIVEIELGQFLGYQKDSKLKIVTISGKNQTKILVPFAPLPPPYHCDFAKNQTNSGEYQQGFLGFFGQKDNWGPPPPPSFLQKLSI